MDNETTGQIIEGGEAKRYNIQNAFNGSFFVFRKMVSMIRLYSGQKLLDIGCGPGEVLFRLHRKYGNSVKFYGIDPSQTMIDIAMAKARKLKASMELSVAPGERLQFPDASFDWIITSLALHHVPSHTKQQIIEEAYRVLKPDGKLLITDFGKPITFSGKLLSLLFRNHAFIEENFNNKVAELLDQSKFKLIHRDIQLGFIYHTLLVK